MCKVWTLRNPIWLLYVYLYIYTIIYTCHVFKNNLIACVLNNCPSIIITGRARPSRRYFIMLYQLPTYTFFIVIKIPWIIYQGKNKIKSLPICLNVSSFFQTNGFESRPFVHSTPLQYTDNIIFYECIIHI